MKKILTIIAVILLLSSCGGKNVARVGDIKITPEEFGFYLNSIKTQMQSTELKTDEDWQTQEIEGKKAIDIAKERALEIAVKNALYIETSKAAGIKFSADDITTNKMIKSRLVENHGGVQAYNKYLKDNNITDRFIDMMIESSAYLNKIQEKVNAEKPETDEEILNYYEENRQELESRYKKAKHILFSTREGDSSFQISQPERERIRKNAQHILQRAREGEDFDALMNEFTEDPGLSTNPDGYVFGAGEMVAEFEECVNSLDYTNIEMCESEFGYHIVKRLPVTFEDLKEYIIKEIREKKVEETVYGWAEEYGVEIEKIEENYKEVK